MNCFSKSLFNVFLCSMALCAFNNLSAFQSFSVKLGPDYPYWTNGTKSGQKVGYVAGVSYNYRFNDQLIGEIEMLARSAERKKQFTYDENKEILAQTKKKLEAKNYMFNLIYRIDQASFYSFVPYFGGGMGWQMNSDKVKIIAKQKA